MQNLLNEHQHPITKALAEVGQKASKIPTLSRSLWNADTCPEALLPYLAWACSVDFWRETWPAEKKTQGHQKQSRSPCPQRHERRNRLGLSAFC